MKAFSIQAPTPQGPAAKDQQAFLLGVTFQEAAVRAGIEDRAPSGAPILTLCPMIVCYAFAAELYLKSLATRPIKNHRLNVLYNHLCADIRDEIASCYKARTGRNAKSLDDDVKRLATAFVDWRYVFEGQGQQLHVNLLVALVKALYEVVRLRQPNWSVNPHQETHLLVDEKTPTMTVANLGGGTFLHVVDGTGGKLSGPT